MSERRGKEVDGASEKRSLSEWSQRARHEV
jgi:hypothetical protein